MVPTLLLAAAALPAVASCPLTLPQTTVAVQSPAGWRGYVPGTLIRLTGFGMLAGPPESMAYLVPDAGSNKQATTWSFERGEEKWLYCTYDGSSAIQIAKPMPPAATTCTITYQETKLRLVTGMQVVCK